LLTLQLRGGPRLLIIGGSTEARRPISRGQRRRAGRAGEGARQEAKRSGHWQRARKRRADAHEIDLVDGEQLAEPLRSGRHGSQICHHRNKGGATYAALPEQARRLQAA
jgi:hypothetical protein